jgi:hypothetical protein
VSHASAMKIPLMTLVLLLTAAAAAVAGGYYKWVDDTGTVHLSDSLAEVPPQYRGQIHEGSLPEPPVAAAPVEAAPATPEEAAESTAAPSEPPKFEVQYRKYEGHARRILVDARFNDRVTAPMALDTGSPDTLISVGLAQRLGLFDDDHSALLIRTGGIGGSAPAIRVVLDKVEIGGAVNHFVPATVVASSISPAFDGLIGMGFVASYQVHIDPLRHVITFQSLPPREDTPAGRDEQWWRNTFKDFALHKNGWKRYGDYLRHESRSPTGGISDPARLREAQEIAEAQYRAAERLYDKLNRYAIQHYVPMAWRQ